VGERWMLKQSRLEAHLAGGQSDKESNPSIGKYVSFCMFIYLQQLRRSKVCWHSEDVFDAKNISLFDKEEIHSTHFAELLHFNLENLSAKLKSSYCTKTK
jgi:hypothetical protein